MSAITLDDEAATQITFSPEEMAVFEVLVLEASTCESMAEWIAFVRRAADYIGLPVDE
eukprot:COSAG01_NODE_53261_length_340_cov_1.273859_1_plen_57_part_01